MKRLAFAIVLVAAVGAGVLLALNWPRAQASPGVTITVNATVDWVEANQVLTLSEAILLAGGDLSVGDLGAGECARVSGTGWVMPDGPCYMATGDPPGAASADTIVFDTSVFPPGSPATITFPMFSHGLAGLFSGGDTVDGSSAGVVVDGGDVGWDCFRIYSNDNVIKGLEIYNCKRGVLIEGGYDNIIGGSAAGEGNVISGNDHHGVEIKGGWDNVVKGNYIGTNADGTAAIANSEGVRIQGGGRNIIGGSTVGERNVISGNTFGVGISGADGNMVKGNYIGTNADGTAAIPNSAGVTIYGDAQNNSVGGGTSGEGNVISGHEWSGIEIGSGANGNTVKGNYIGTDASGTAPLPNGWNGVRIWSDAQNNSVGGTAAGEGNTIAFNGKDGVLVAGADSTGNAIRGNSIHSNGEKGIENEDGGNAELSPPTVESVGSVFGTACPDCTIDVYSDDEDEGRVHEGSTTADGAGNWSFSGSPQGPNVTATATDSDGNTSEFSEPLEPPWPTPTTTPTPIPTSTPTPTATPTPTPTPTPPADTDGDTVPDDVEEAFGSDPTDDDSTPESLAHDPDTCTDGLDNDGDGDTDAEDEGCADTDGDGFDDATEEELGSDPDDPDSTPEDAAIAGTCTDGVDNDGDGVTDGEDEGCRATRTLLWGPGWHNVTWSGASTPEEAFACAAGNYAAAYRLVGGGWERYFPDRPDLSNMTDLAQYETFLILVTGDVTCQMEVADPPGAERTLDWGVGWQNEGWTGADGMPPEDVFDCADGSYAAAYRLVGGGWERYFPGRPDLSNMGPLDEYDAFLILVTASVSCSMAIAP